jgi:hypothetical protein
MSLLREIQDAAVDGASDLESLLRKCRVLATRLRHDELKNWVISELDGYPKDVEVPQYRKLIGSCYGHFAGYGGSQVRNAPIPVTSIPEQLRDGITRWEIRQGVSALKSMVDTCDGMNLDTGWPAEASSVFGGQILRNMGLVQVWTSFSKCDVVGILSTIRNRILNFALEIEASYPAAGEAAPGVTPVPKEVVTQIFNQTFHGPVANVASGHGIEQTGTINIQQGDFRTLAAFLKEKGVADDDLKDLEVAIKGDPPPTGKNFGKRVSAWMGKMMQKSAEGAWKVTTTVGANLLTKALEMHYGIHP